MWDLSEPGFSGFVDVQDKRVGVGKPSYNGVGIQTDLSEPKFSGFVDCQEQRFLLFVARTFVCAVMTQTK